MGISKATIEDIIANARIEEVIGRFIDLKKKGPDYKASCPFHEENDPSFSVSPSRNIYKCFGCGKGGNSINFLMEYERLEYIEAVRWLSDFTGIEVELDKEKAAEQKSIKEALQKATEFYFNKNDLAVEYLVGRGYTEETIKKFAIGYADSSFSTGKRTKLRDFMEVQGFNLETLLRAGLIRPWKDSDKGSKNWNDYRDFFEEGVMFPVRNHSGKIVGFGARHLSLDGDPSLEGKDGFMHSKYINSPSEVFLPGGRKSKTLYNKTYILYGFREAMEYIRSFGGVVLVEGYTDVNLMWQMGIPAIAPSGTAFTPQQAKLISRFTKNVINMYDPDGGGFRNMLNVLAQEFKVGLNPKSVFLPDGFDPASYFTSTEDPVQAYHKLEKRDALATFLYVEKKLREGPFDTDAKWELMDSAFENYISWHEDKTKVLFMMSEFARQLNISVAEAQAKFSKQLNLHRNVQNDEKFNPKYDADTTTQFIVNLLINNPSYAYSFLKDVPRDPVLFKPYQLQMMDLIEKEYKRPEMDLPLPNDGISKEDLYDSVKNGVDIIKRWVDAGQLDKYPSAELNLLTSGLNPNLSNLAKILNVEYRHERMNALHREIYFSLAEGRINESDLYIKELEKLYYENGWIE